MKRKFYLLIIPVLILSTNEISTQQWTKITPVFNPPGNYNLERGIFLNEYNGWFVDSGKIFQTTDEGLTWNLKIGLGNNIGGNADIFFFDGLNGWALFSTPNDSTIIYRTTDSGNNWKSFNVPKMARIYFINRNTGIGVDRDCLYKTVSGGETWEKINLEPYEGSIIFNTIFFLNEKKGWICGGRFVKVGPFTYPVILSTNDGGNTWRFNSFKTDYNMGLIAIAFADSLNGVVCENIAHYNYTNDGGKNWIRNNNSTVLAMNILFTDEKEGWMTGVQGFIGHSTDKGKTWEKILSPTSNFLGKTSFVKNNSVGFIFAGLNTLLRYEKPVSVDDGEIIEMPAKLILHQNYPNPFNSSTILTYELPEDNFMELMIYDLLGRKICVIEKGFMNRGEYKAAINVQTLSSGTYFCILTQGKYFSKIKLILIK